MKKYIVRVFSSISLDGGLGVRGARTILSSENDFYRQHILRSLSDAIVVGANTVLVDDPMLTIRLPGYTGKQPYRIIIDKELRLKPYYRVFNVSIAPTVLVTSYRNRGDPRINPFIEKGVDIIYTGEIEGALDLRRGFELISSMYGVRNFLVEGGGILIGSLLKQRLVDEIIITITPNIIGLDKVDYIGVKLDEIIRLKLLSTAVDEDSGEVILTYKPVYK
jgi:2,5-diamino-6-(ribosylamino)-4(3H)-pyrimidinone 5'-phosphate reductase